MSENKAMSLRLSQTTKARLDDGKLVGQVAWGWVFDDKNTYGNHPFPDGMYIHTSTITEIKKKGNKITLHTLNSTYNLI